MNKSIPINLLALNERGNNLLTQDGDMLFFAEIEPGLWFFADEMNIPDDRLWALRKKLTLYLEEEDKHNEV